MNLKENINDSDFDSDSDEYINVETLILTQNNNKNVYQFQLDNLNLLIKKIGTSTSAPEMIIRENFGPKSNLSLYSCVYMENELESINDDNFLFPIIKLINSGEQTIISSFAIKIKQLLSWDNPINDFELFWVQNIQSTEFIKVEQISKNINSSNIIEKLIESSL